jgi:hypothetical protein
LWGCGRSAKLLGAEARRPRFSGMAVLCHGVTIEPGHGRFDLVVRLSTLRPKERIPEAGNVRDSRKCFRTDS